MRGIDPQSMVIAVRRANGFKTLSTIGRARDTGVENIHRVRILWIRKNMMEIPGTLREPVIRIDEMPAFASILAAVDAALFRFNDRVDTVPIRARYRYPDAPQYTARQSVTFETLPSRAIIAGAIQTASRAAADHRPRRALRFPERGEQNVRIIG